MKRRIVTWEALAEAVEEYGFLPFFPNSIPGFSVKEMTPVPLWFSEEQDGPWEWKGPVLRQTGCAYGRLYRGKSGFVSREWYPDFANLRRNGYDFDARYDEGLAPRQDKYVYELLSGKESLLSGELKRLGGFGRQGRKGFDSILTRLQMQGYLITVNFEYQRDGAGNPYGWGVSRYATPERYYGGEFVREVYRRTPEESAKRILAFLRRLHPEASQKQLMKLLG